MIRYTDSVHKVFAVSLSIILASMIYFGILFPHAMTKQLNLEFRVGSVLVVLSSAFFFIMAENKYQARRGQKVSPSALVERELELKEQNQRNFYPIPQPKELQDYLRIAYL